MRALRVLIVCGLGSVSAAACSSESRSLAPVDAGSVADAAGVDAGRVDAAVKTKDAGDPFSGEGGRAGQTCERSIDVGALSLSGPAGFVNEHVSNKSGTINFPCDGGKATVVFAGKSFVGDVSGDTVTLSLVEPFIFNSCQWQSTETIAGDLATGKLTYDYSEKPLAACTDMPCTASGSLDVASGAVVVVK